MKFQTRKPNKYNSTRNKSQYNVKQNKKNLKKLKKLNIVMKVKFKLNRHKRKWNTQCWWNSIPSTGKNKMRAYFVFITWWKEFSFVQESFEWYAAQIKYVKNVNLLPCKVRGRKSTKHKRPSTIFNILIRLSSLIKCFIVCGLLLL